MIANLLKFYEGAIAYRDVMRMSFEELLLWEKFANKMNREIEKGMKK